MPPRPLTAAQKLNPVPSDIEVSQSFTPLHISDIAADAGILPEELELYGNTKAKVIYSSAEQCLYPTFVSRG